MPRSSNHPVTGAIMPAPLPRHLQRYTIILPEIKFRSVIPPRSLWTEEFRQLVQEACKLYFQDVFRLLRTQNPGEYHVPVGNFTSYSPTLAEIAEEYAYHIHQALFVMLDPSRRLAHQRYLSERSQAQENRQEPLYESRVRHMDSSPFDQEEFRTARARSQEDARNRQRDAAIKGQEKSDRRNGSSQEETYTPATTYYEYRQKRKAEDTRQREEEYQRWKESPAGQLEYQRMRNYYVEAVHESRRQRGIQRDLHKRNEAILRQEREDRYASLPPGYVIPQDWIINVPEERYLHMALINYWRITGVLPPPDHKYVDVHKDLYLVRLKDEMLKDLGKESPVRLALMDDLLKGLATDGREIPPPPDGYVYPAWLDPLDELALRMFRNYVALAGEYPDTQITYREFITQGRNFAVTRSYEDEQAAREMARLCLSYTLGTEVKVHLPVDLAMELEQVFKNRGSARPGLDLLRPCSPDQIKAFTNLYGLSPVDLKLDYEQCRKYLVAGHKSMSEFPQWAYDSSVSVLHPEGVKSMEDLEKRGMEIQRERLAAADTLSKLILDGTFRKTNREHRELLYQSLAAHDADCLRNQQAVPSYLKRDIETADDTLLSIVGKLSGLLGGPVGVVISHGLSALGATVEAQRRFFAFLALRSYHSLGATWPTEDEWLRIKVFFLHEAGKYGGYAALADLLASVILSAVLSPLVGKFTKGAHSAEKAVLDDLIVEGSEPLVRELVKKAVSRQQQDNINQSTNLPKE